MADKEKNKIVDILFDFYDEYQSNEINRPMIPSIYADKILDSLKVKAVDLEKELIEWHKEHFKKDRTFIGMSGFYLTNDSQMDIAKHFFELGVNASNPLTWEDVKLIWTIGDEIPYYMPEEDFFKELLKRFKAQKGK